MILSIIILNYNTKDLTLSLLNSLFEKFDKEIQENKIEVILADNASSDGSPTAFKKSKYFSKIILIENKENFGFSKGNNIAFKNAGGNYTLFLNSDTEVSDKGFLNMAKFLDEDQEVGIVGGKLINLDGSDQMSAGKFYTISNLFLMLIGGERLGLLRSSPAKITRVDWVSGACLMIRRELFEKLKGFDENLFMYMEDMELCYRARKDGALTYFYPDIKLIHRELGSGNKNFAILNIYKGISYFYRKHMKSKYELATTMLKFKAWILNSIGKEPYGEALKILR